MEILYDKKIATSTGIAEQVEIYKIIKQDSGEIHHYYEIINEFGEDKKTRLLLSTKTNEKISEHKCHLCGKPAEFKISIGDESEYYCSYHRAEVLRRLLLYKAALKYWREEVKYAEKDFENRRIRVE